VIRTTTVALAGLWLAACSPEEAPEGQAPAATAPGETSAETVATGAAGPEAATGGQPIVRKFRDWLAVCDNGNRCTALTGSGADDGWIKVEIEAGPDARPTVRYGSVDFSSDETAARPRLTIDGESVPADASAVAALTQGRRATITAHDRTRPISLSGAAAALLWIDERQGRLNTTTALVRRGDQPAASVPVGPDRARVTAVPLPGQKAEQRDLPAALTALDAVKECQIDVPDAKAEVWRVGVDRLLWIVPCWRGAYNFGSRLYIADEAGAGAQALGLPTGLRGATPFVVNGDFDPETGELSSFDKGRGLGDCGYARTWVWTGRGFALKREVGIEECWGLSADEWPVTYEAVVE
jgi:hypothetical protein